MSERPRVVFAACRPPFPLENGARIRTHRLLTGLAGSFDTVLLTFEFPPGHSDGHIPKQRLEELLPGIEVVTVPAPTAGKRRSQIASLAGATSWTNGRYASAAYTAALEDVVARHRADVVHFDDAGVAMAAPVAGALNVYCAHNIEQALLRFGAGVGSAPRRAFNALEAAKVAREERRIWRGVDLCLAVSGVDAEAMRAGGARRVELCPNGVDEVAPLALPRLAEGEPLRLLFVGSGNYAPYERGLAWLVREVLPLVRARTRVAFDVVGSPPAHPVHAEDVSYVGTVPTVEPSYERAHVVVVPVFEGSGTRLKIIEAAAYGRPVVSTRLGAEGLPLEASADYLQADDAAAFAERVLELDRWYRDGDERLERMVTRAREAVAPLAWPRVVAELASLYRDELARRANGIPARPRAVAPPAARGGGLLIVNADDWGIDRPSTEAICACLEAGAVTSVSAMVFMDGSEHAALIARERAVPAGLHINLTEPFSAGGVDPAVRARQARLVEYFGGPSWRRWGISPSRFAEIERAVADQLAEFRRLYGREPSHFDGHEHIHQSLSVLASRTLPRGVKMRSSFTYEAGEKSAPNRATRALLNRLLRARFAAPRYLFSIRDIHPALGGSGLERKLALAGGSSVEVMTHPGWEDERALLLESDWTQLIGARRLGSYDELSTAGGRRAVVATAAPREQA